MRPKLILTDLDGTLLREDKSLSPVNRAALERAAAQGAEVVLATGRFYGGIPQELRDLPFLRYFILMNGQGAGPGGDPVGDGGGGHRSPGAAELLGGLLSERPGPDGPEIL